MSESIDILVVDDERINLKLIEGILRGPDRNLILAETGEEALRQTENHDFAVALLDVMMPGMDGFVLAERLRNSEKTKNIPIIFITAISKEQRHVFRGYGLGAVDYLFKPVEPEVLRGKVAIFAEMHRNNLELQDATHRLEKTVHELEQSRSALKESEQRYRMVADYNHDWESWIDPDGNMVYVSPACERISGYPPEVFYENPGFIERIIHSEDMLVWQNYMSDTSTPDDRGVDFRINDKRARVRWVSLIKHSIYDENGYSLGLRTNIRDVTSRKQMEEQLRHTSLHDPLTGLPNKVLFLDRVGQALQRGRKTKKYYAVAFFDLDRFQAVNDHYGHTTGDILLVKVGLHLKQMVSGCGTAARFGGDEFVLLLEGAETRKEAKELIETIKDSFQEPFEVNGIDFSLSVGVGMDVAKNGSSTKNELIHNAQLAMYKAKTYGKNHLTQYTSKMREGAVNVIAIESDLRRGLANDEFEAYYQPIVNLADGKLYGFEALARWNHPERGMVSPGEFIPVAEETGLIVDLGAKVLTQATTSLNTWRNSHQAARDLTMAVNISAKQFEESSLVGSVEAILDHSGLPAHLLKLEITETVVMSDAVESTNRLRMLKSLGVLLSIDDFGTGYSSMSYLQKFPLDQLKVDLSFVRRMEKAPENVEIVRAIINMAHSLRLRVVAEGIETERQRDLLYSLQCDYGQGYLYSKPVPGNEAEEIIINM